MKNLTNNNLRHPEVLLSSGVFFWYLMKMKIICNREITQNGKIANIFRKTTQNGKIVQYLHEMPCIQIID